MSVDLPAESPACDDHVCDHVWQSFLSGGRAPVTVSTCQLCGCPDWDDLNEQVAAREATTWRLLHDAARIIVAAGDSWEQEGEEWKARATRWACRWGTHLLSTPEGNTPVPSGTLSLVDHARRELALCGQIAEDPEYTRSLVDTVAAFASFRGHSGGSHAVAVAQLTRLLRRENLSPLTTDPGEWEDRSAESGRPWWQNNRDSRAMSHDGGVTYWRVDDPTKTMCRALAVVKDDPRLK